MTPHEAFDLVAAAIQGLVPRPISEAPKDGSGFITDHKEFGWWSNIRSRIANVEDWSEITGSQFLPLPSFDPAHAAELTEAVEMLRADVEWQPIETAPKDMSELWLCDAKTGMVGPGRWTAHNRGGWIRTFANQPTHWKPLSLPPQVAEGQVQS